MNASGQEVDTMVLSLRDDNVDIGDCGDIMGDAHFARQVQAIATDVSYTAELAEPEKVKDLIRKLSELAIVQVCSEQTLRLCGKQADEQ
jgi:hypothetical protein